MKLSKQEDVNEIHDLSEDISLGDILKILNSYKKYILILGLSGSLIGFIVSNYLEPIYTSEITMISQLEAQQAPNSSLSGIASIAGINLGSSSGNKEAISALETLKSRTFLSNFIKKYNYKPDLHPELWDKEKKSWKEKEPSDQVSVAVIKKMIRLKKEESGLMIYQVESYSAKLSKDIANNAINYINSYVRQQTVEEAEKSISFLKKELESTNLTGIQQTIYSQIEAQTKRVTLASVRDQYSYKIIDSAVTPYSPSWPNKQQIVLLGLVIGAILGVLFSLNLGFFKKKEN